jgi:uroporphyrinogen-III decarboxylase
MHSCGKVDAYIDSLIEVGVNVLNLQQPRVFGDLAAFGRRFAGRVCLEALCDPLCEHTLPFASDDVIRAEARLLVEHWGTPAGGFVLSDYGDGQAIGVPLEKKQVMLDAFRAADRWRKGDVRG